MHILQNTSLEIYTKMKRGMRDWQENQDSFWELKQSQPRFREAGIK